GRGLLRGRSFGPPGDGRRLNAGPHQPGKKRRDCDVHLRMTFQQRACPLEQRFLVRWQSPATAGVEVATEVTAAAATPSSENDYFTVLNTVTAGHAAMSRSGPGRNPT